MEGLDEQKQNLKAILGSSKKNKLTAAKVFARVGFKWQQ